MVIINPQPRMTFINGQLVYTVSNTPEIKYHFLVHRLQNRFKRAVLSRCLSCCADCNYAYDKKKDTPIICLDYKEIK